MLVNHDACQCVVMHDELAAQVAELDSLLTDEDLVELVYVESDGQRVTSSLTGSGYDLSLFRLRSTS